MSFKKKLLFVLAGLLIVSLCVGVVAGAAESATNDNDGDGDQGFYTFEADGATMTVNKENLSLVIEKNGRTWYSGKLSEADADEENGLTAIQATPITDAVTVTYRNFANDSNISRGFTYFTHKVTFNEKPNGFDATVRLTGTVGITFKLNVRFDGHTVTATVPYSSINESSATTSLAQLNIYPYFDSSYMQTQGQILIPDGSGALIDMSVKNSAKSAYSARVYGDDYGFASTNSLRANSPARVTMPVLAMLYPDGGTMAVASSGAEYARVNAAVSGMTNDYNRAYFSFIYREEYIRTYEGGLGNTQIVFPEDKNEFDAQVSYTLLDEGSDVIDVANAYRDNYLDVKKNVIDNVGLRLQFLMAENKQGMFGRETVEMTTTAFVEKVAKEVAAYANGLTVSLTGYQRGGLGGTSPSIFPISGSSKYKSLSDELTKINVQLNFRVDYVRAHDRAGVSNYNLAQNISEQFIVLQDIRAGSSASFSLIKPSYSEKMLASDLKKLSKYNAGIEYETLGALLYSGFKQEVFTRSELIQRNVKAVGESGMYASLSNPNDYMFQVIDSYVDAPLEYSSYLIETESVPFLQMVLSGHVPMYSSALNLDYTGQNLVLRLIDSNVYPSFILTEQDAIELYGTDSQGIFTSSFDIWKYSVKETYEQVNSVLREVVGQTVTAREKIADNVYATTYSNGVKVVVNYSSNAIDYQGRRIGAQSAAAVR